jgi:mannosyltransferase OCH1-like enzyme
VFLIYNFSLETFYNLKNVPDKYNKIHNDNHYINHLPKIIHHICPKDFRRWSHKWFIGLESWLRLFPSPEYTHMYWFDDELNIFIKEEYPWFLDIFNSYDVNIKRIDIVRPFILYKYGGIYSDMDYVVYKNFFDELPTNIVSIPKSPYTGNEIIQNSFIISPPQNIFLLLIIDNCYNTINEGVFSATGPTLFSETYLKYPELLNILPYEKYNPHIGEASFNSPDIYAKHLLTTAW